MMNRASKHGVIPIAILHRNESQNLITMVETIRKRTSLSYHIFVVDNCSDARNRRAIQSIAGLPDVTIIQSDRNNWILGFNLAIAHSEWPTDARYYVFSDADIVVPDLDSSGLCWLHRLINEMDSNACIGKLGISLKTDDIDHPVLLNYVVQQRMQFNTNPRIGSNVVAPVDTTLAIYRKDFFVGRSFKFRVGHASLARPYYYTCRTSGDFEARHLGWYVETSLPNNSDELSQKVRCFAIYGGCIASDLLAHCRLKDALFYAVVRPLAIIFWGLLVVLRMSAYVVARFPRRLNEIQSRCR